MAGTREKALENLERGRSLKTGRRPDCVRSLLNDLKFVEDQAFLGMDMEAIFKIRGIPRKNWDQIKQLEAFYMAFDKGRARLQQYNLQKAKEMIENGKADVMGKYLSNYNEFSEKPVVTPSKIVVKLPEGMKRKQNSGKGQKKPLKLVNGSN